MGEGDAGPPAAKNPVAKCVTAAFTYRTAKLIRVYDGPLVTFFRVFTVLGYIYGIFLLIIQRGYQKFTSPSMSILLTTADSNVTAPAYVQNQLLQTNPPYCNSTLTYYNYSTPERVYDNIYCAGFYKVPEFTTFDSQHIWVYTFFQQRTWQRTCQYEATSNPNGNATFPYYVSFPNPANCTATFMAKANAFIYGAENTQVTIQPFLHVSGGNPAVSVDELTLVSKGAVRSGATLSALGGGGVTLQLSDLISAAGANLDAQNKESGGYGVDDVYSGNSHGWPTYRMTGMRIVATVDITNFHANPLNSNVTFDLVSKGDWVQPPRSVNKQGNPNGAPALTHLEDLTYTEKEWSGVEVVFVATGTVGAFDIFETIQSLLNIFVVLVAVGSFVDSVAPFISPTFARDKYDDEGERALVTAMLEKSADHGVPFDLDDLKIRLASGQLGETYEAAILRLEKEIEDVAAGKDRLRMAAKTLAAKLELDGDEILDEKVEAPEPIMKLMSPDGTDEIALFAGEQVIGRGMGQVKYPTISRRQVMLTVEKDSLKAFAKSLKGKGNSIPGVKRGDNPWRQLTEKGQSISIGDRLCMQYKKNGPGGREEIINEYLYVPLDQLPEQRATLWSQLEKTLKTTFGQS